MRIVERGFPGHYICASRCAFVRNTAIHHNDTHVVVSTVGNMINSDRAREPIGSSRYYETMVFHAYYDDPYWEADESRQIQFDSEWSIGNVTWESDYFADRMHDRVVEEITNKIEKGEI